MLKKVIFFKKLLKNELIYDIMYEDSMLPFLIKELTIIE